MEQIINISKTRMVNNEHFQYYTEVIELIERTGADTLKIESLFAEMLHAYHLEDEAMMKITKSALTQDIKQKDKERDTTLAGINDRIRAAHKHFNTDVQNAAKKLKILFNTYGNVARKPLNEETSAVFNILQELNGKYAADVDTIGIADLVNQLELENNAVAQLMRERRHEAINKQPELTMKKARKMLDNAYDNAIKHVNAFVTIEGEANYKTFLAAMNKLIADFKIIMAQRAGRAAAKNNGQMQANK